MRHRLLTGAVLALLAWPATGHAQSGGASVARPDRGRGLRHRRPRPDRQPLQGRPAHDHARAPRSASATASTARARACASASSCCRSARAVPPRASAWAGSAPGRTLTRTLDAARRQAHARRLRRAPARGRPPRPHAAPQRHRLGPLAPHGRRTRAAARARRRPRPGRAGRSAAASSPSRARSPTATASASSAARPRHRGQDILAAQGTPVVTPRAGTVTWRAYQADGAGNYVVIRADDGRDFVFMHLLDGSITVAKGDTADRRPGVRAGRPDRPRDGAAPALRDLARRLVRLRRVAADRPARRTSTRGPPGSASPPKRQMLKVC